MNKRAEIMKLVAALGEYYDKPLSQTQLAAYTEDLLSLEPAELGNAILIYRNDPRNERFPLPVKLKAMIGQVINPDDEAVLIAGRILNAISRIGPYESAKAKQAIGPVGWQVVECEGGWESICEIETDDLPTRKAQWRNLAKSFLDSPRQRSQGLAQIGRGASQIQIGSLMPTMPKGEV